MRNIRQLKKRLERLESRLLDSSGRMPYTKQWFLYWTEQAERLLTGEDVPKPPIAFFDALFRDSDRTRLTVQEENETSLRKGRSGVSLV